MSQLLLALLALVFLGVAALILAHAEKKPSDDDEPEPFTLADPRCRVVARKLDDARRSMIARGVPLLLVDRPPWKRVTGGQVIEFRR